MEFEASVTVSAPGEAVWNALTDLDATRQWLPGVESLERLEGEGPVEVGHAWRRSRTAMGQDLTERVEVTGLEAPDRLDLHVDGSTEGSQGGEYRFTYRLEPVKDRTLVRLRGEIEGLPGCMGWLFSFFLKRRLLRFLEKDLAAFRDHVEKEA